MATVDGITAAKAQQIANASVASGHVDSNGDLILVTVGGTEINAGAVTSFAAINAHAALTAAHGATGAVVGTTNAQTLSNKTVVLPIIASFLNAQHTHGTTDGGGPLAIGKADAPAPVTSLTSVNMADGDAPKTLATITCPAGRWLILAACEGVTLGSASSTRFAYDLAASQPSLIGKVESRESAGIAVQGGAQMWGWLDNSVSSVVSFRILKNGTGALLTTSATGALLAIRMG